MASNTSRFGLLKKDPLADGNDTFNIKTMLNDNWDKLDDAAKKDEVDAKYTKPTAGIPKTDLASAVQASLGKADTALQTVPTATASVLGGVKVGTNISVASGTVSVANGSTSVKGVVQLTDSTASASTTTAATPNSVKQVNDALVSHQDDGTKHISADERQYWNGKQDILPVENKRKISFGLATPTGGVDGDIYFQYE